MASSIEENLAGELTRVLVEMLEPFPDPSRKIEAARAFCGHAMPELGNPSRVRFESLFYSPTESTESMLLRAVAFLPSLAPSLELRKNRQL
jgi:hypothetical protein